MTLRRWKSARSRGCVEREFHSLCVREGSVKVVNLDYISRAGHPPTRLIYPDRIHTTSYRRRRIKPIPLCTLIIGFFLRLLFFFFLLVILHVKKREKRVTFWLIWKSKFWTIYIFFFLQLKELQGVQQVCCHEIRQPVIKVSPSQRGNLILHGIFVLLSRRPISGLS